MIVATLEDAVNVLRNLDPPCHPAGDDYHISEAIETYGGWLLAYNSLLAHQTGNELYRWTGGGPVLVERNGTVHFLNWRDYSTLEAMFRVLEPELSWETYPESVRQHGKRPEADVMVFPPLIDRTCFRFVEDRITCSGAFHFCHEWMQRLDAMDSNASPKLVFHTYSSPKPVPLDCSVKLWRRQEAGWFEFEASVSINEYDRHGKNKTVGSTILFPSAEAEVLQRCRNVWTSTEWHIFREMIRLAI